MFAKWQVTLSLVENGFTLFFANSGKTEIYATLEEVIDRIRECLS